MDEEIDSGLLTFALRAAYGSPFHKKGHLREMAFFMERVKRFELSTFTLAR